MRAEKQLAGFGAVNKPLFLLLSSQYPSRYRKLCRIQVLSQEYSATAFQQTVYFHMWQGVTLTPFVANEIDRHNDIRALRELCQPHQCVLKCLSAK